MRSVFTLLMAAWCGANVARCESAQSRMADLGFRAPAVPLITNDPYLSIWSMADKLTGDVTRHWTKHPHALVSLIRIDGKVYRLMGNEPATVPALPQTGLEILPTRTIYHFAGTGVDVAMTFLSPLLPYDLNVLSRPASYITWQAKANDGRTHSVAIYDSLNSQLAVNTPDQYVRWGRERAGKLSALHVGTQDQFYLHTSGDDVRIDWGNAYLAAPSEGAKSVVSSDGDALKSFVHSGVLPGHDDKRMPRATTDDAPVLAFVFDIGKLTDKPVSRHVIIAYDEVWAIKYMGEDLRPYWRRNGASPASLLETVESQYTSVAEKCAAFDEHLITDMERVGGPKYAQLGALAYRQTLAGIGIAADDEKQPLMFTKENTSNGDAATVDVIFPASPELLLFGPTLAKSVLAPVLVYGSSSRWTFPNAPHDLEKYPIAKGTDDGGEQMPVEESGNLLLLVDGIAKEEGSAEFAELWWPALTKWAKYLEQYGNDPEEQLCTDDFMGHLAHNANLSIKAILGLAAYGNLAARRGDAVAAEHYKQIANQFAEHWLRAAADGDHSRLAFDKPGTWSQKYNLIWDQVLGLRVFPAALSKQEVAFYESKMEAYGVPLDSRSKITETPWSMWTAALADNANDFERLINAVYKYQDLTVDRLPFTDVYQSDTLDKSSLNSRSVVGGVFIRMLTDPGTWQKWASADHQRVGPWAPIPKAVPEPEMDSVEPKGANAWRYTTNQPDGNWTEAKFDDGEWKTGVSMFGQGNPNVRTEWNTGDIWMRRTFIMPAGNFDGLRALMFHNGDAELYIDGRLAEHVGTDQRFYDPMPIPLAIKPLLKAGAPVTLAVHCRRIAADQEIDVKLVNLRK